MSKIKGQTEKLNWSILEIYECDTDIFDYK